jgi:hypothetical protein
VTPSAAKVHSKTSCVERKLPIPIDRKLACRPSSGESSYPRYKQAEYEARCLDTKLYWDPQFKCQKCLLAFQIISLDEDLSNAPVYGILNLKNENNPGRRSRYRHEWIIANNGPPRRGQTWSTDIFVGKIFLVRVGDTLKRWDNEKHHASEVYSTVQAILKRLWP